MFIDIALVLLIAALSFGMAAFGGHIAAQETWQKVVFWALAVACVAASTWQGIRLIVSETDRDNDFIMGQAEIKRIESATSGKVDALFTMIETRPPVPKIAKTKTRNQTPTTPNQRAALLLPPNKGALTVTQSNRLRCADDKVSTRQDAPYEIEVVVQTTTVMPSLKMAIECDTPITDAVLNMNEIDIMSGSGVLKNHQNVFIYHYESSMTPFGPSHPVVADFWSKERMVCDKVATF